jgi:tRNA-modifying protein YgfZ
VTYESPLLTRPGAVAADAPDAGVAAHYGDPFAEQRRLEAGSGWVDLSHHDVIRIAGADRVAYLHAMASQVFEGLEPGHHVDTVILSPQGHVEHVFGGWDDGSTFLAHTEPGRGQALVELIESTRFMMRVEASVVTEEYALVHDATDGPVLVERTTLADRPGEPSGVWAHEALRIAGGRFRFGVDSDHRTIPNELGLIGTVVHVDKGCYRGQETVAKIHNLGRPPRRLTMLHLDGSADRLPAPGAEVSADGAAVGVVGSAARHYELGPIGLALLKRATPVDASLLADGIAASQEIVVDPDVGLHVRPALRSPDAGGRRTLLG